ncbi:hypothetical protein MF406_01775 [Georgenia sp. TF02-10]|uniref:FtsX-like permease family protein n=1 Tax=Georgenia sp. TF02-10 TaxID=2917725 RepID=UPI001FA6FC9E|nr:FtsX-like permease family protein [Georgenia sp. TF02-10]UNX55040.1 hypothetical protein MF406_01775 [Georgenia sp. TF02-10]
MTVLRLVRRRLADHPAVAAAVAATTVVAVVVLTALDVLGGTLARGAVAGAVTDAAPDRRAVVVTGGLGDGDLAAQDEAVRRHAAVLGRPTTVHLATRSVSFGLPAPAGPTDLARLAHLEGIAEHADLVAGTWPAGVGAALDGGTGDAGSPDDGRGDTGRGGTGDGDGDLDPGGRAGTVAAAVPEPVAQALGWSVGQEVVLSGRLPTVPAALTVTVAGVYRATDPADPFWLGDAFANTGVEHGEFTTYGPLVVPAAEFAAGLAPGASATWRVYPDTAGLTAADVPALRAAVADLLDDLAAEPALAGAEVTSTLPDLLADAAATLAGTRDALRAPTALLALLAGTAIAVGGTVLGTLRAPADLLLRARGAARGQLLALAAVEAGALAAGTAVVAALAGPALAAALPSGAPPSGTGGLPTAAGPGGVGGWPTAVGAAAAAGALLLVTSARTALAPPAGRGGRLAVAGRAGIDVALLGLGAVGYLQLRRAAAAGQATADPLVVLAPALVVLAGSLLALRLLPLATRAGQAVTGRARGLPVAWTGWQVARHLPRRAGLVVLLVLAAAAGSLALVHRASAAQADADAATHTVGAESRVLLPPAPPPDADLRRVLGPAALPVLRRTVPVADEPEVTVLAVDADRAPGVLRNPAGPDLAPLLRELGGPAGPGEPLPAVVTPGVLTAAGAAEGDVVELPWRGGGLAVAAVATTPTLPSVPAGQDGILLDLAGLSAVVDGGDEPAHGGDGSAAGPDTGATGTTGTADTGTEPILEWWLPGPPPAEADLPPGTTVLDRAALTRELAARPVRAGTDAALVLLAGTAAVLATLGYAVAATADARRGRGELAVLHALGAPPRAVRRAQRAEQAAVVVLAVGLGLVVGVATAAAVVPPLLAAAGQAVLPAAAVVPWAQLLALGAALALALAALGAALVRPLGPAAVPAVLRRVG